MAAAIEFRVTSHFLGAQGQRDGFVLLGAFLITFLFIRTSARLMRSPRVPWWPGSVTTSSGLHLHHLVWGIVLTMFSGFLSFVVSRAGPVDVLGGLIVLGLAPFDTADASPGVSLLLVVAIDVLLCALAGAVRPCAGASPARARRDRRTALRTRARERP